MSLFFYIFHSLISLIHILISILAFFTFTHFSTSLTIVETRTIHFQTISFCTTTRLPFLLICITAFLFIVFTFRISYLSLIFIKFKSRVSKINIYDKTIFAIWAILVIFPDHFHFNLNIYYKSSSDEVLVSHTNNYCSSNNI